MESSPCFTCLLPDCDEDHPGCAFRQQQQPRRYSAGAVARYRVNHPIQYHTAQIAWQKSQRIERALLAIRRAA